MKKLILLIGVFTIFTLSSCSEDTVNTTETKKELSNNLEERCWGCKCEGSVMQERYFWKDQYNSTFIGEYCVNAPSFCDLRPIVFNSGDVLNTLVYKLILLNNNQLLAKCIYSVPLTEESLINQGVDSSIVSKVLQSMSSISLVPEDVTIAVTPGTETTNDDFNIVQNFNGQSLTVKAGEYVIDYSTNPMGNIIYNVEVN